MKFRASFFLVAATLLVSASSVQAQGEDIRAATGLPIKIGQPVIYGRVLIRNLPSGATKPTIAVTLMANGTQVERSQTNESGYYYFLRAPGEGMQLLFEIDGSEIGRDLIPYYTGSAIRRDIEVDWRQYNEVRKAAPGVVSVKDAYPGRSPEASANRPRMRSW